MKLFELSPTDKIKLAAELAGYKYVTTCKVTGNLLFKTSNPYRTCYCPDYSTSYDAIIPLIQKQPKEVKEILGQILDGRLYKKGDNILYIENPSDVTIDIFYGQTPSQLLDALLITIGKAEL